MISRLAKLVLYFGFLVLNFIPIAQAANKYTEKLDFVCHTILNNKSYNYSENFSKNFRNKVSEDYLKSVVSDVVEAMGPCRTFKVISETDANGLYQIFSAIDNEATIQLTLDAEGLIDGLSIQDLNLKFIKIKSWEDATFLA
jgi:hypothetical protein